MFDEATAVLEMVFICWLFGIPSHNRSQLFYLQWTRLKIIKIMQQAPPLSSSPIGDHFCNRSWGMKGTSEIAELDINNTYRITLSSNTGGCALCFSPPGGYHPQPLPWKA